MMRPAPFTEHAVDRIRERYGSDISEDERWGIMRRLWRGKGIPVDRGSKSKWPTYLVSWDRLRVFLVIVLTPDQKRVATVLPPEAKEVQRLWAKMFG